MNNVISIALQPSAIAIHVPMPALLRELGFTPNERTRRCPCRLHGGRNPSSLSWEEDGRWFCFNCAKGGDKFTLVQEVRGCNFPEALRFLAAMAGVTIDNSPDARREIAKQQEERRKDEEAARKLRERERKVRRQYKEEVWDLEQIRSRAGKRLGELNGRALERFAGEESFLQTALEFVSKCLPRALTGYTISSFANIGDRARFAIHPEARESMIDQALFAGHVITDDRKIAEVLT